MPTTSTPTELYTAKTLFTLGGSSVAVWLFTTILALVFDVDTDKYKWIGLCVALAISFVGVVRLRKINLQFGTIAFFNGLLIYVTAVGIDSINQGALRNKEKIKAALLPFTEGNAWWPTATLVDSIEDLEAEKIMVIQTINDLEFKNKLLYDSLSDLNKNLLSTIGESNSDKIKTCLDRNITLQSEIGRLKKELEVCQNKTSITPVQNANVADILKMMKSLNKELLNNLNEYLDAGDLKPKTQLEALRNANENVYALKLQIEQYNSKIDELINKTK